MNRLNKCRKKFCVYLTLSMLSKNFSRQLFQIFFFICFSQKIGFGISCKLFPHDTICMKCQSLFSGKNIIKKSFKMSSAEIFTQQAKH